MSHDLKDYRLIAFQDLKTRDKDSLATIRLAKKLKVNKRFYKADFDQNGIPDLLTIGEQCFKDGHTMRCDYSPLIILNFRDSRPKIEYIQLDLPSGGLFVPRVQRINGQDLLEIQRASVNQGYNNAINVPKTLLTYKFGGLIEYRAKPVKSLPIMKIEFSTGPCFGTCPVFELRIDDQQNAKFVAQEYNFNQDWEHVQEGIEGEFHTRIKDADYQKMIEILNYIDLSSLKSYYSVPWTDDQDVKLTVRFGDEDRVMVNDYGKIGTYGLARLYQILFDLRRNQNWIKD